MKTPISKNNSSLRNPKVRIVFTVIFAIAVATASWFYLGNETSFAQRTDAGKPDTAHVEKPISPEALNQIAGLLNEKKSRTTAQKKIDSRLLYQIKIERKEAIAEGVQTLDTGIAVDDKGFVSVDITAKVSKTLLSYMKKINAEIIASYPRYHSITARVPILLLEDLASQPDIVFIMPKQEGTTNKVEQPMLPLLFGGMNTSGNMFDLTLANDRKSRENRVRNYLHNEIGRQMLTGSVTAEGDTTHRANVARSITGFDGTGIKIGVLSNGVNTLAARQASGDLPLAVNVLPGQAGSGDEGTAMLEIVYDTAPGAQLYYATASNSFVGFAQNIRDLRTAGCDIIIDDYTYYYETPFQDGQAPSVLAPTNGGILVEAVNDVTIGSLAGALYFSSAANSGNKNDGTSGVWEGDFVDGGVGGGVLAGVGVLHNFGPGTDDQLTDGNRVILKWSDPLGGSANDYDAFALNPAGTAIVASSTNDQTGTQDPLEDLGTRVTGERIVIAKVSGEGRFLHLNTNRGQLAVSTSGVTYGHNAGRNTISVAASPAGPAVNNASVGPFPNAHSATSVVETFSSDGPRRIFYNADSSPITPGNQSSTGGELLQKPDITAADGVTTTTPTFIPFFGTSAAAPQAGALMALLKQASPISTRTELFNAMTSSAIDIEEPGVDRDSGAGIFMPLRAMNALGINAPAYVEKGAVTTTELTGNGNTRIEAGETWNVAIDLDNLGLSNATNVTATLSTTTPDVVVLPSETRSYPDIPASIGSASSTTPFQFQLLSGFACGAEIALKLTINFTGGGSPQVIDFSVPSGVSTTIATTLDTIVPPTDVAYVTDSGLQTGRLVRNGARSSCALSKLPPGLQDSLTNRRYDSYKFTASTSGCITVTLNSPGTSLYVAAYGNGGYVPSNPNTNYRADPGTSSATSSFTFFSFIYDTYTIVVHEITPSGGATPVNYNLKVSGPIQGVCASPTANNNSVMGRTLATDGSAIANALVVLTDANGNLRTARSNSFGYYKISNIPADFDYILSAKAKGSTFASVSVDVTADLTGVDLTAQ